MKRLLILGVIVAALGMHASPAESADATGAWNQVCASYDFNSTFTGAMGSTFAQNYNGSNFSADFAAILEAVANLMGTNIPPFGEGDIMNSSLQHWPDT